MHMKIKASDNTGISVKSLLKYFGVMNNMNIDWKAKEERMKAFKDSFNKRIEETSKYMEKARRERKHDRTR